MKLLVVVINDRSKLTPLLDRFYELGVKGATVIDSQGMGHLIADHIPFFSRFAELSKSDSDESSYTVFSLIRDQDLLEKAMEAVEETMGDLYKSDTGLLFVIPVDYVKGCPAEKECEID